MNYAMPCLKDFYAEQSPVPILYAANTNHICSYFMLRNL